MAEVVETIAVYPVQAAPDGPLGRIEEALEDAGFDVDAGRDLDLAARRGLDRVFVGVGPHEEGLVARWKAKSLLPWRIRRLHRETQRIVGQVLGEPTGTLDPVGGGA